MTIAGIISVFVVTAVGINQMAWTDWMEFSSALILSIKSLYSHFIPTSWKTGISGFG